MFQPETVVLAEAAAVEETGRGERAVQLDVFLQNEDGTPSTQLKKRIYDLKCSLHGGIIPVSVPPEVPLREFPYNAVVELVKPVADTVSRKTYTGADVDWYVKAEDIVLKNKGNLNTGNPQNHTPQGQSKK